MRLTAVRYLQQARKKKVRTSDKENGNGIRL